MEEWHQKLHNNTSPDDVVICQVLNLFSVWIFFISYAFSEFSNPNAVPPGTNWSYWKWLWYGCLLEKFEWQWNNKRTPSKLWSWHSFWTIIQERSEGWTSAWFEKLHENFEGWLHKPFLIKVHIFIFYKCLFARHGNCTWFIFNNICKEFLFCACYAKYAFFCSWYLFQKMKDCSRIYELQWN